MEVGSKIVNSYQENRSDAVKFLSGKALVLDPPLYQLSLFVHPHPHCLDISAECARRLLKILSCDPTSALDGSESIVMISQCATSKCYITYAIVFH